MDTIGATCRMLVRVPLHVDCRAAGPVEFLLSRAKYLTCHACLRTSYLPSLPLYFILFRS